MGMKNAGIFPVIPAENIIGIIKYNLNHMSGKFVFIRSKMSNVYSVPRNVSSVLTRHIS